MQIHEESLQKFLKKAVEDFRKTTPSVFFKGIDTDISEAIREVFFGVLRKKIGSISMEFLKESLEDEGIHE